jgi:hypothetical protein
MRRKRGIVEMPSAIVSPWSDAPCAPNSVPTDRLGHFFQRAKQNQETGMCGTSCDSRRFLHGCSPWQLRCVLHNISVTSVLRIFAGHSTSLQRVDESVATDCQMLAVLKFSRRLDKSTWCTHVAFQSRSSNLRRELWPSSKLRMIESDQSNESTL